MLPRAALGPQRQTCQPDAGRSGVWSILPSHVWPVVICLQHAHAVCLHTSWVPRPTAKGPPVPRKPSFEGERGGTAPSWPLLNTQVTIRWTCPRKGHGTLRIHSGQVSFLCSKINQTSCFHLGPPQPQFSKFELQTQVRTNENTFGLSPLDPDPQREGNLPR